jgi:hypothetical protein
MSFRIARFILAPFAVGLLIGLVAGLVAVGGSRLLNLELLSWQESLTLVGFTVCFGIFGLVDSVNRFAQWKRTPKSSVTRPGQGH